MIKNNTLYLYSIIAILWLCCGCSRIGKSDSRLMQAENYMDAHPDSALSILKSIQVLNLDCDEDKALYGMLYTQALDKNYCLPTDDSLISFSVDFYDGSNDVNKQAISNYYQGRVCYHNCNLSSAIVSFFKAKQIAENNGLFFWAGMAARGISDIYNKTYNSAEELTFAKDEYELIQKSGIQPYLNYALHDLGRAYYNNKDIENSKKISLQLQDSAMKYDDEYLHFIALKLQADNLMLEESFKDAQSILEYVCSNPMAEPLDSLKLCMILIQNEASKTASDLLNKISDADIVMKKTVGYMLAKKSFDYYNAFENVLYVDSVTNAEFKTSMSNNLTSSLIGYYELRREIDEQHLRMARLRSWLLVVIIAFLIISILGVGKILFDKYNNKMKEKITLVGELEESLAKSEQKNKNFSFTVRSLIVSKNEMLEHLGRIAFENKDSKEVLQKIADEVYKTLEELSDDSNKISELIELVDKYNDNLYTDFKSDLPDLKDADYKLFLFSFIGLSNPVITLLLKEDSKMAVYNRKKRLKNKIKQLDKSRQDRYLAYL